ELLTASGAMLAIAVAGCGVAVLAMPHALDFLTAQQERGLQVEAMAATPFVLARALGGWDGSTSYQLGATELVCRGVGMAELVSLIATPVGLALIAVWWLRAALTVRSFFDAALTTVLFLVITSRVLSPQYLVWVIGIAAVVLSLPRGQSSPATADQRPAAWL